MNNLLAMMSNYVRNTASLYERLNLHGVLKYLSSSFLIKNKDLGWQNSIRLENNQFGDSNIYNNSKKIHY